MSDRDPADFLPRARDLPRIIATLRRCANQLEERGSDALIAKNVLDDIERRDKRPRDTDPFDTAIDGPRSPTEAAAMASKWLPDKQLALRSLLEWLDTNATDALAVLAEIVAAVDPAVSAAAKAAHAELVANSCCEPKCEDPAERGCSGRCRPCCDWRHDWSIARGGEPAPPVPESVIQDRIRLREGAAVYVSGPFVGERAS